MEFLGGLTTRDRASLLRWKSIFAFSLLLAAFVLWPTLSRYGDGDDSYAYYDAGLRSWSEVLGMAALPPGLAPQLLPVTRVGDFGKGTLPSEPVFVFGRWRPFSQFVFTKALWTLGLTPAGYRLLSWVFCWLASLSLAWGVTSAFALAEPVPPETVWVLATLLFWSVPTLFASTISFFTPNAANLLVGLAIGILCRGGAKREDKRGPKAGEIAVSGFLGFLACESHENAWWLIAGFAGFLGLLTRFRKLRPGKGPRYGWPLALLVSYVLIYRSLSIVAAPTWGAPEARYTFAPAVLWSRFSYLMLAPLAGLSWPFVSLLGVDLSPLDIEPARFPLAFALTCGSLFWIVSLAFSQPTLKSRDESWVHWVFGAIVLFGAATILPYCVVHNLRLIYYSKLLADALAIAAVFLWIRLKRPRGMMLMPWLLAGIITLYSISHQSNWLERNSTDSRLSVERLMRSYPELASCSAAHPCCLSGLQRSWELNEWVLSYNLGAASKTPSFYPEQWPGALCERHLIAGDVRNP